MTHHINRTTHKAMTKHMNMSHHIPRTTHTNITNHIHITAHKPHTTHIQNNSTPIMSNTYVAYVKQLL